MRESLIRRFSGCFHFDYSRKTRIYAAATYLDLHYRDGLSAELKNAAKDYLKSECPMLTCTVSVGRDDVDIGEDILVLSRLNEADVDDINCSASLMLAEFSKPNNELKEQLTVDKPIHPIITEFEFYERMKDSNLSMIDFWLQQQSNGQLPFLSNIALDILSIPSSSTSVERLFSAAGRAKSDVRTSLSATAVENECIIRLNHFLLGGI